MTHDSGAPAELTVGTWFVADDSTTATSFPSTGKNSSAPENQIVYWKCAATFYALAAKTNPDWHLIFYTNVDVLPRIEGVEFKSIMDHYKVEVINLPISHRLPKGSVSEWGNQFYILDVINDIISRNISRLMILDSDCVFTRAAPEIPALMDENGALTLTINYEEEKSVNGASRIDMRHFCDQYLKGLGRSSEIKTDVPYYFGGEFFCATKSECFKIAKEAAGLWSETVKRAWDKNGIKEEAHFLSIIYDINGYKANSAINLIKRMWTSFQFNNTDNNDLALPIWHLPGEKRLGFLRLFHKIIHENALEKLSQPGDVLKFLKSEMGVPRRSPKKFVFDAFAKGKERLAARFG